MECTIFDKDGRKELHYWEQHLSGCRGIIYQVSEKSIDLIRNCKVEEIQQVISYIEEVSHRVWTTNSL